jgi:hypothetical protein
MPQSWVVDEKLNVYHIRHRALMSALNEGLIAVTDESIGRSRIRAVRAHALARGVLNAAEPLLGALAEGPLSLNEWLSSVGSSSEEEGTELDYVAAKLVEVGAVRVRASAEPLAKPLQFVRTAMSPDTFRTILRTKESSSPRI